MRLSLCIDIKIHGVHQIEGAPGGYINGVNYIICMCSNIHTISKMTEAQSESSFRSGTLHCMLRNVSTDVPAYSKILHLTLGLCSIQSSTIQHAGWSIISRDHDNFGASIVILPR